MLIEQKVYKEFILQSIDKSNIPINQAMELFKKDINDSTLINNDMACVVFKVKANINKTFNRPGSSKLVIHRHYHGPLWYIYLKQRSLLI